LYTRHLSVIEDKSMTKRNEVLALVYSSEGSRRRYLTNKYESTRKVKMVI